MKQTYKTLGVIFFVICILLPSIAFFVCCEVGEDEIFGTDGILRYSWIFLLFVPVALISFFIGLKLKKLGLKYKKNYVVAFIVIPFLIIFGSYRWVFGDMVSFDRSNVENVESKIEITFPNELKISTSDYGESKLSYAKILNDEEKKCFENQILEDKRWTNNIGTLIENQMPRAIKEYISSYEYCICVFENDQEFLVNEYPDKSGIYICTFVGYDFDLSKLVILNDYSVFIDYGNAER